MFLSFIGSDGYNPLTVATTNLKVKNGVTDVGLFFAVICRDRNESVEYVIDNQIMIMNNPYTVAITNLNILTIAAVAIINPPNTPFSQPNSPFLPHTYISMFSTDWPISTGPHDLSSTQFSHSTLYLFLNDIHWFLQVPTIAAEALVSRVGVVETTVSEGSVFDPMLTKAKALVGLLTKVKDDKIGYRTSS